MVKAPSRSLFVLCIFLTLAPDVRAQPPAGALAIDEGRGDPYGWAVDHQTAAAGSCLARVRRGVCGGADVRPVRGICGRSGQRRDGVRLGGIVCLGGWRPTARAGGVSIAWRVGVHGSRVGLQRPGGRGAAGSRPSHRSSGAPGRRISTGGVDGLSARERGRDSPWQQSRAGVRPAIR